MTRGKNYLYNIQGKVQYHTIHTGNSRSTNHATHSEYIQSASQGSKSFLNCTSMQLESRTRVTFGAEMLQGIGLMFPDIQEDDNSSPSPRRSWDKDNKSSQYSPSNLLSDLLSLSGDLYLSIHFVVCQETSILFLAAFLLQTYISLIE